MRYLAHMLIARDGPHPVHEVIFGAWQVGPSSPPCGSCRAASAAAAAAAAAAAL